MKYGVNMMVWTTRVGEEQAPLLARIQEWGFDGVELFLSTEEPANLPEVKCMLDGLRLERTTCVVLPRDAHLVSREAEVRTRGVNFLNRCVERTADLGAQLMCGPLYAGLGVMTGRRRTQEERQWAADGLAAAARATIRRCAVYRAVEPVLKRTF